MREKPTCGGSFRRSAAGHVDNEKAPTRIFPRPCRTYGGAPGGVRKVPTLLLCLGVGLMVSVPVGSPATAPPRLTSTGHRRRQRSFSARVVRGPAWHSSPSVPGLFVCICRLQHSPLDSGQAANSQCHEMGRSTEQPLLRTTSSGWHRAGWKKLVLCFTVGGRRTCVASSDRSRDERKGMTPGPLHLQE